MTKTDPDGTRDEARPESGAAGVAGNAPLLEERIGDVLDPELAAFIADPLPKSEMVLWAALTPANRLKAARRLEGLRRWSKARGAMHASTAATIAGVKPNRFYRMVSDWRAKPSIASLGVLAVADRSANARIDVADNAVLMELAATVVREAPESSVSGQVTALRRMASTHTLKKMPGDSRLRQYVEVARRRTADGVLVGNYLVFDCAALPLLRGDGRPWILFAAIDRRSGLILGHGLGEVWAGAAAFVEVAGDVLNRIRTIWASQLPWATRCARIDCVVAGATDPAAAGPCIDARAWIDLRERALRGGTGVDVVLVTGKRRHGSYFRELVGPRIGRFVLTPARAGYSASGGEVGAISSRAETLLMLEAEVAAYNLARRGPVADSVTPPPLNLVELLEGYVRLDAKAGPHSPA